MKICPRRHPKPCRFFELYQKCKFGTFCAFKHCESLQVKEITHKSKVEDLQKENIEKTKEISFLIERLDLVEQIIAETEREEVFIAATKVVAGNKTPVVKGTNQEEKEDQATNDQQIDAKENSDDEVVLTAEQIAEVYEDKEPPTSILLFRWLEEDMDKVVICRPHAY